VEVRETESEAMRREIKEVVDANAGEREALEDRHGQVWDTEQLRAEFQALGFAAPFIRVQRRSDGVKGAMMFQHHPRYYFCWEPD
jgi:hypothetical protein